ncbi:MAG: (p)ppGpp synthetase [Candidatus Muiribacterium halophilum]|uniref:(P)ppGpp synthetase n=1 Tax=Muiribacterium halophilum TaxID=2053465 RepID=A0A2N5ZE17_MUIH1|nr:MAG: (p)ppGpp synthetase [Candidatus Muirbacterium halophilum]
MDKELALLINKVKAYAKNADTAMIEKAYHFAKEMHKDQKRKSGEPYFMHPYNVALIITDLRLDSASICAALLHDVVEDCDTTKEEITEMFSAEISHIVEGVTKISKLKFKSREEAEADNLRKMLFAMIKDLRVILVKLADRLHNMSTLEHMKPEKQIIKSRETLEIYAPLAHRLGIGIIKSKLEDLCLKYLEPEVYQDLSNVLHKQQKQRDTYINEIITSIGNILDENKVQIEKIYGRTKHFYSIFRKMKTQNKSLDEIYDLIGIRIITDQVKDCYGALGFIHKLWPPIPGRFKDYIAMPKSNMYQSLHTTIMHPMGFPVEFQIRTLAMHQISEVGIAAHFAYKEGKVDDFKQKTSWLRQLLDWHKDIENATEFLESVKIDLFQDEVFIFTPQGDVKSLTRGATPIDFAFAIHTEVGSHCSGAKVNGKLVPLTYELHNGDIVEIITSKNQTPSREWLNIAKTSRAKNKIRSYVRKLMKDNNIDKGMEVWETYIKKLLDKYPSIKEDYSIDYLLNLDKIKHLKKVLKEHKVETLEELYVSFALKSVNIKMVVNALFPKITEHIDTQAEILGRFKEIKTKTDTAITLGDIDSALINFAKCCNPIPYDPIVGFVTMGKGITIHRKSCPNVENLMKKPERIIEINWNQNTNQTVLFTAMLRIETIDKPKLLSEITQLISQMDINIASCNAYMNKQKKGIIDMGVQIKNIEELRYLTDNVNMINGVLKVYRIS